MLVADLENYPSARTPVDCADNEGYCPTLPSSVERLEDVDNLWSNVETPHDYLLAAVAAAAG